MPTTIVPADGPPTAAVTLMRTTALSTYLSGMTAQAPGTVVVNKNSGGVTGGTKTVMDRQAPANPTFVLDRYTMAGGGLAGVEVVQCVYRTETDSTNADGQPYRAYDYRVFVALAVSRATPPGGSVACMGWYVDPTFSDPDPWDADQGGFGCPLLVTWTPLAVR